MTNFFSYWLDWLISLVNLAYNQIRYRRPPTSLGMNRGLR
ncbi:hypothetical protein NIES932_21140 [Raphidiopsis curvata NIES-932]|nr:hypothetical protein NIES932_21140 [Raphidiopsis curvata NIES-932]